MTDDHSPTAAPRLLRALLFLGLTGVGAELLLIEHTEGIYQLLPLGTLALCLVALLARTAKPSRLARGLVMAAMLSLAACGAFGVILHYDSNAEFQAELEPELEGWGLFVASMRAKSPPALAPGALTLLGLLGLVIATMPGPRLSRSENS